MIKSLLTAAVLTAGLAGYALAQETAPAAPAGQAPEMQQPAPTTRHHVHHVVHHHVHHHVVHHVRHVTHHRMAAPAPAGGAPAGAPAGGGTPGTPGY
jgi:hypothetical protein